jgi:hypothetical protein
MDRAALIILGCQQLVFAEEVITRCALALTLQYLPL